MELTLDLSAIAVGEAAQALALGLESPHAAPALAQPYQAEGGKGTIGTKTGNLALPSSRAAQGTKGGPTIERTLPRAAAAQGAKGPAMWLPTAAAAQGDKNPV